MITAARLDATDRAVDEHRAAVCELCRRHGEDPDNTAWVEYDVVDLPLLRFGVYQRDADGSRYLACSQSGPHKGHPGKCVGAMRTTEHALIGDLPQWWTPG